ncbi:hypothetical protein [Enterococcus italicus]|uniref:hypothetical protein n=1 Tax=Enterococcus italicus TaxID=246144 RepID=UPI002073FAC3|nr:hypothetical protein [Enterococcus italicus]
MTTEQFETIIKAYQEKFEDRELGFDFVGVRFENAEREVNEVLYFESKDNSDREDVRDFPKYGSDEYEDLPDMGGVSSYDLEVYNDFFDPSFSINRGEHCYIIASYHAHRGNYEITCDEGEVVIARPTVLAKIW